MKSWQPVNAMHDECMVHGVMIDKLMTTFVFVVGEIAYFVLFLPFFRLGLCSYMEFKLRAVGEMAEP